jgi:uncharacterized protein (TIGR03118 family)
MRERFEAFSLSLHPDKLRQPNTNDDGNVEIGNTGSQKRRKFMSYSVSTQHLSGRAALLAFAILFVASNVTPVFAQYKRTNLASNQPGVTPSTDPRLINSWGLTALPTSPFWLSDNGSGFSTLYTGGGQQILLFVTIPPSVISPAGPLGTPTGVVGNISPTATDFTVTENGKSGRALFIFATQDGTISAWNPVVDGVLPGMSAGTTMSHATIVADHAVAGATYTGLAIATNKEGQTFLYAADGGPNRAVDMYDGKFAFVKSFSDPKIPRDFTTYGIQAIKGEIWVTFTALNKAQGGFVDVFATDGTLLRHDAIHGPLHSPWGIAQAPADFGPMSNAILISNNISRGRVNAFDPNSGGFLGPLRDANGNPIEIDNIWALQFGQDGGPNGAHNQLFFTGGPNGYANGIFGVITFGQ